MTKKFRQLYDYCQTLEPKIKRNDIKSKVLEIAGVEKVACIKLALDTSVMRGLFLSVADQGNEYVRQIGSDIIVLPRGLNDCWDRFIYVKELMHLLDHPEEKTSDFEEFSALLAEFEAVNTAEEWSKQYASEVAGAWMATACLCPERHRVALLEKHVSGELSHYEIALHLKIPEQQVRNLFRPNYLEIIGSILD